MALIEQLIDDFHTLDSARWTYTAGRASINAGRLQVTAGYLDPLDMTTARYGGEVWSVGSAWDLRGSHLTMELPTPNGAASGITEHGVFVTSPRTTALMWQVRFDPLSAWGWQLRAVRRAASVETVLATLRLDLQEQRWLRVRETAGTVYWDTSPDGFGWVNRASVAVGSGTTSAMQVFLGTRYESPGDVALSATWDSLNVDLTAHDPVTVTGDDGQPYLAVDVQPDNVTGAFRVGTSKIGGADRIAWSTDDPATWVNMVCNVRSVSYQRGATRALGVLTTTEAGTATVLLEDTAGQFDPNVNGDAIRKGTPARLRAWGTDVMGARWDVVLFTAELDESQAQYLPDEDAPLVTLTLVDLVAPLTAWESEGVGGDGTGAGDNLLQRALRIVATVGRGEVSAASSASYTATLAPTLLQHAWDELQAAATAELGRLWVDRHNRMQLRSRGSQPSGPVRGTLSDVHGEAPLGVHGCMADAAILRGAAGMANRVLGRRLKLSTDGVDPTQQRRDDELSQRLYGVASVNRSGLLLQTDAQVAAWAGALIVARTRPELLVDSVTPAPPPGDLNAALEQWPAVLSTDIADRWLFQFRPRTGPPIVRGVAVLGISATLTPDRWSITWTTETASVPGALNPTGWFVIGTSTIGGSDLLAPYPAPYAAA